MWPAGSADVAEAFDGFPGPEAMMRSPSSMIVLAVAWVKSCPMRFRSHDGDTVSAADV
jgi:hypothetical protein